MVEVKYRCVLCGKTPKKTERRPVGGPSNEHLRACLRHFSVEATDGILCNKCRHKCRSVHLDNSPKVPDGEIDTTEYITLDIPRAGASHSYCFICRKPGNKMVTVKSRARYQLFVHCGILLSKSARCCPGHICYKENIFTQESIRRITLSGVKTSSTSQYTQEEILDIIKHLRVLARDNQQQRVVFNHTFDDDDYKTLTGLKKSDFEELFSVVSEKINNNARNMLGVFLTKMRSGLSNRTLGTIFHMKKSHVSRCIKLVREALSGEFVANNLGFGHVARDTVISEKTRPLAKFLLGNGEDKAILVLDGTYLYIQKSNNFQFQRRSFSMHKRRPLVKPMMVVTTTGYIVSVLGPYLSDGKNNDASILNHVVKNNIEEIKTWVRDGDVFVVDRGFRDSEKVLDDLGVCTEMPKFLPKGKKQFETEDANKTRFVTKIRWVVESANSRLKQWKFFDKTITNTHLPQLPSYLRIMCSIFNKFLPPLSNPNNTENDMIVAQQMMAACEKCNDLQNRIENEQIPSKLHLTVWNPVDASDISFPSLSDKDLREITLGVYTLKLAKSYATEHVGENGVYELILLKNSTCEGILAAKIQSRHTSSLKYHLWIEHNESEILGWYCRCRAGSRVVGTCAHVASVIWYLAKRPVNTTPFLHNWHEFISDAAEP